MTILPFLQRPGARERTAARRTAATGRRRRRPGPGYRRWRPRRSSSSCYNSSSSARYVANVAIARGLARIATPSSPSPLYPPSLTHIHRHVHTCNTDTRDLESIDCLLLCIPREREREGERDRPL